jgi:3,4-dihydroxy-2-butanone 4-phosphate synthase
MKIEISIEKGEEKENESEMEMPEEELTPEQIAKMAAKLKGSSMLSRAERTMLANYLLSED